MKKRILASLLSFAMCAGLIGVAFAGDPVDLGNQYIDKDGNTGTVTEPEESTPGTTTPTGPGHNTDMGPGVFEYTVNIPKVTGGSVSANVSGKVYIGQRVTLTVNPESGYALDSITVTTVGGYPVELTDLGGGQYTFLMPSVDVNVNVSFRSTAPVTPAAPSNPFTDVKAGEYYYDAVLWAVENGITTGKTTTLFAPGDSCTRAQAVTFIWRAAGEPEPTSTVNPFTDVDAAQYYYKAVLWAVEKGITTGTNAEGTQFSPADTVNRAQMVTFLYRAAGQPSVSAGSAFGDVDASAYYAAAVQWAVAQGITTGEVAGVRFGPGNPCTRGQIVTFLYRAQ